MHFLRKAPPVYALHWPTPQTHMAPLAYAVLVALLLGRPHAATVRYYNDSLCTMPLTNSGVFGNGAAFAPFTLGFAGRCTSSDGAVVRFPVLWMHVAAGA